MIFSDPTNHVQKLTPATIRLRGGTGDFPCGHPLCSPGGSMSYQCQPVFMCAPQQMPCQSFPTMILTLSCPKHVKPCSSKTSTRKSKRRRTPSKTSLRGSKEKIGKDRMQTHSSHSRASGASKASSKGSREIYPSFIPYDIPHGQGSSSPDPISYRTLTAIPFVEPGPATEPSKRACPSSSAKEPSLQGSKRAASAPGSPAQKVPIPKTASPEPVHLYGPLGESTVNWGQYFEDMMAAGNHDPAEIAKGRPKFEQLAHRMHNLDDANWAASAPLSPAQKVPIPKTASPEPVHLYGPLGESTVNWGQYFEDMMAAGNHDPAEIAKGRPKFEQLAHRMHNLDDANRAASAPLSPAQKVAVPKTASPEPMHLYGPLGESTVNWGQYFENLMAADNRDPAEIAKGRPKFEQITHRLHNLGDAKAADIAAQCQIACPSNQAATPQVVPPSPETSPFVSPGPPQFQSSAISGAHDLPSFLQSNQGKGYISLGDRTQVPGQGPAQHAVSLGGGTLPFSPVQQVASLGGGTRPSGYSEALGDVGESSLKWDNYFPGFKEGENPSAAEMEAERLAKIDLITQRMQDLIKEEYLERMKEFQDGRRVEVSQILRDLGLIE